MQIGATAEQMEFLNADVFSLHSSDDTSIKFAQNHGAVVI